MLSSQLIVTIGSNDAAPSSVIQIEADARDAALNRPAQVNYTDPPGLFLRATLQAFNPQRIEPWEKILELDAPGVALLRLYCLPFTSRTNWRYQLSEPPAMVPGQAAQVFSSRAAFNFSSPGIHALPNTTVRVPSRPDVIFPPVEDLGSRQAVEIETLAFNWQRAVRVKRPWVDQIEILYGSQFMTREGVMAAVPQSDGHGVFTASAEVAGCLIVRYTTHYRLLRCNYGLPTGAILDELRMAWLRGDIAKATMPPLLLFVLGEAAASQYQIERQIWPSGIVETALIQRIKGEQDAKDKVLTETARQTSTRRISSPTDPDHYIDVEHIQSVTLQDGDGKPWQLKFNGNPP